MEDLYEPNESEMLSPLVVLMGGVVTGQVRWLLWV